MKRLLPLVLLVFMATIVILFTTTRVAPERLANFETIQKVPPGICPPYYLLTDAGDTINPLTGKNSDQPYSPRQTCGKCHDYEKITQGYHFQQGKDESPDPGMAARAQWVSSPGNYGGPWCSPHPLYNYLSPKENESEKTIDMTSYTFVKSCGVCHPGGGSLEFDRNGLRYDRVLADTSYGFADGGINDLDGDYYKAKWQASGIIEADCFLCHMPAYNYSARNKQIENLNYRWAGTVGAGLAKAEGFVANGETVKLTWQSQMFNAKGQVEPHVVRSPRNEACLNCHAKPGWKKRGANFSEHTDVHIRAGVRCVDCHPAGNSATHDAIRGKEVHQFGKGDDPSGFVRNDLDNTMRSCNDCHTTGYMGSPLAKHAWLPPLHLDKMSCQSCHIAQRNVKSVHYAASEVFNPGTRIPTLKQIWTFYGPDMQYWNHYGQLSVMKFDDKPIDPFHPEYIRYKGVIHPANRVHTSWPGIEVEGKPGLMQPRMAHVHDMWMKFKANPESYPELKKISDHNGDQIDEINLPEEIDAIITSLSQYLSDIQYPIEGKRVVWVYNNRVYSSGDAYTEIGIENWQASPYGNVHTYNHDIQPARGALGAGGCTDCHSIQSGFFTRAILMTPFGEDAQPITQPQYKILEMSGFRVYTGLIRETYLKPLIYFAMILLMAVGMALLIRKWLKKQSLFKNNYRLIPLTASILFLLFFACVLWINPAMGTYILPTRFALDALHFWVALVILAGTLLTFSLPILVANNEKVTLRLLLKSSPLSVWYLAGFILALISGVVMLTELGWIFYTLFDLALLWCLLVSILNLLKVPKTHLNP